MNANKSVARNLANRTRGTLRTGSNAVRNTASRAYTGYQESSTLTKVVVAIFVVFLVILLIYWIIHAYSVSATRARESPFIVTNPINAFSTRNKSTSVPDPSEGMAFTYSLWIYVADWNYRFGQWKNIFLKGNNNRRTPGMWLYPKTNALHARISTHADANEGCDIKNIPLQKWVHIVYVLNNRNVDIYIDGKLERSCVLKGVPLFNSDRVIVGQDGGFYGQISKMQYFTRALQSYEISEIYSEGPKIAGAVEIGTGGDDNGGDNGGDYCPTTSSSGSGSGDGTAAGIFGNVGQPVANQGNGNGNGFLSELQQNAGNTMGMGGDTGSSDL